MAFETRDRRAAVIGMLLFPMHPEPDGEVLTKFDRMMITGIYPIDVPELIKAICGKISISPSLQSRTTITASISGRIKVGSC